MDPTRVRMPARVGAPPIVCNAAHLRRERSRLIILTLVPASCAG